MIIKLALRNILGAGFRTWLNIFILSLSYFTIIAMQGFLVGWQEDATREIKAWDIAEGQYWQQHYDPYDPYSLDDSYSSIPTELQSQVDADNATAILISTATIYPDGRMRNITLKGIDPNQQLLALPTAKLLNNPEIQGCIIGANFARQLNISQGDYLTLRWRDKNGTFDATDIMIKAIFSTTVIGVDNNQIWIPLDKMQQMLDLKDYATIITVSDKLKIRDYEGWIFRDQAFLLQDLENMIQAKSAGSSIMYILLLFLAMLAIFDTQILSIFRRRKEIGTMMALGLTRLRVIILFTMEGVMHAILAVFMGAIYGLPLLKLFEHIGLNIGPNAQDFGLNGLDDTLYPIYTLKLVVVTIIIVLATVTIVSYLPTRRIAELKPTDALKGKFSSK